MASPQLEDGYTSLANEIMEALAKISIPSESRRILDFILRKTYGWHKKEDAIPLTQFEKGTGLRRSHVCRAINRLVEMKLIYKDSPKAGTTQSQGGDYRATTYGFNKDFEIWVASPRIGTSPRSGTGGSPQAGNKLVPARGHSKEIQKKKEQKKEYILRDVKPFIDFYYEKFKERFGTPPVIEGGKDGSLIKSLLKIIPLEELKALLGAMFDSEDPFILKSGYTLGVFKSQINKLKIGDQGKATPKHLQGLKGVWEKIKEEEKKNGEKAVPIPHVSSGGSVSE